LEQTILKLENFALGKVDEGKKIWNQENGGGAESDKKPKEKPKYQWTTDIMKREWMSGGHGFVRTGAEAARYQREKREARKNAKKPDKKATAEGTNERLDELIKKQDEYFG